MLGLGKTHILIQNHCNFYIFQVLYMHLILQKV